MKKSFLLLIMQQNLLNKSCRNAFLSICNSCDSFVGLKLLGLWRETPVFWPICLSLLLLQYTCYRHFALGECIVYIVSNKRTERFFIFVIFYLYVIFDKKTNFFIKKSD